MTVEVGDRAPEFVLKDQHLSDVRLADFRGEKNVVLVFYPWSFTRVCTGEMQALRDRVGQFQNDETQVLAVSCDAPATQRVFAEREGLDFPVLSDFWPHGAVADAYGVFDPTLGVSRRGTFVIDREGIVRHVVVNDIPNARDADAYCTVLAGL